MGVIRILFLSDTHLGFDYPFHPRIERRRRGDDFFANIERALRPALEGRVDCVVHGGDLLYRSKVPPKLVALAAEPLKAVADAGVPVYLVPGNHERSIIPHFERMHHQNIFVFDRPRTFELEANGIRLALAGFPFYRGNVRKMFDQLLSATRWRPKTTATSILCIHQSVDGATVGPRNYMFRQKHDVIDSTSIPADFAAVLAGHIHRHQVLINDLSGRPLRVPVFYPGSIERTSYAEKDESKGYLILEVVPQVADEPAVRSWHFHHLPSRPMRRVDLHIHQMSADDVTAWIADKIKTLPEDGIVQLRIHGKPCEDVYARIRAAALRGLAPASMNIEATLMNQRRRGSRRREKRRETERTRSENRTRPSWQRPLFSDPPKRKTEP